MHGGDNGCGHNGDGGVHHGKTDQWLENNVTKLASFYSLLASTKSISREVITTILKGLDLD